MEEQQEYKKNPDKPTDNSFESRGCCQLPNIFQKETKTYRHSCSKLDAFNWLGDIKQPSSTHNDFIEVRFKNSRKEFFKCDNGMDYDIGDFVAVEGSPGHDIGIVSLTGELVRLQMKKKKVKADDEDLKKVYRKARPSDLDKWVDAVKKEEDTKYKTRIFANDLNLSMKINDVEYQGDMTKAIFYYTAEERVDFRELIKVLADAFKVRVEMRQIGARQEAARLGGIGSCGRELCCCTWMCDFSSVTTNTARTQQLSLNPQKLAGQCGKLKCCMNYELIHYQETLKSFPDKGIVLKTKNGDAVYQKADVFKKLMWYSYKENESNMMAIPVKKVKAIIRMNKNNRMPEKLEDFAYIQEQKTNYENVVGQDDLTRFDD